MMFQFLADITSKRTPKQSSSDEQTDAKSRRYHRQRHHHQDEKIMARSSSFHSIQSTTSASWLDEKHEFSFKNDYVSFPSLEIDPTECI
ncbi:hypothetical protein BCR42DRAFT_401803 [Absidia repens]|uniref:Uncharacterized protein n=1 Tax=Absidia repens TaxID=90262 RepID=A0A1X2J4Q8_9FUNG|nr:hypothetical protein BCR42DRAFT_401803 [Absidia repens]